MLILISPSISVVTGFFRLMAFLRVRELCAYSIRNMINVHVAMNFELCLCTSKWSCYWRCHSYLSTGVEIHLLSLSFNITTEAVCIWLCNTPQSETKWQVSAHIVKNKFYQLKNNFLNLWFIAGDFLICINFVLS